jgi:hypothetical protein
VVIIIIISFLLLLVLLLLLFSHSNRHMEKLSTTQTARSPSVPSPQSAFTSSCTLNPSTAH